MKHISRLSLLFILPLLISNCASMGRMGTSMGKWFEKTYTPYLGVGVMEDIQKKEAEEEKRKAVIVTSYSLSRDITLLTYTWGDIDGKNIQKTVYHSGNFLSEATSETESVLVRDGVRDSFVFDKSGKLKWCQQVYYNSGELMDSGECGDASYQPGSEEKFTTDAAAKSEKRSTGSLEQKLKDLKELRDKKTITNEEYKKMREKALRGF